MLTLDIDNRYTVMNVKKSLKVNTILNSIKTIMGMIFPLITFPYVSRILMPEGIGKVNFATSIISYFGLLASLGISAYGVREGAKVRDSKKELSKFAKEVLFVNLVSTAIAYLLLGLAIFLIPKFQPYKSLLLICGVSIIFTTLGMEWIYSAIEDFTYITIRYIIFQIFSIIFLFIFVRKPEDIVKYAAITVFASVGSNIMNFIHVKEFISFKNIKIRFSDIKKHLKPVMLLFCMAVTSSIYTILDTSMLGFLTTDYEVGIYTSATKVNRLVLNLVVSIGTVILPRLSYYFGKKDKDKFYSLAYKAIDLLMLVAIPASIGLSVMAKNVILLLSGKEFLDAVSVMRIINPLIIVVSISNFIGVQLFMPLGKEKWTLISDIIGACINIIFNFIFITKFGAAGAAIASLFAELAVTTIQIILARRYISVKKIFVVIAKYMIPSLIMDVIVSIIQVFVKSVIVAFFSGLIAGVATYLVLLVIMKNEWIGYILKRKEKV